MLSHEEQKLRDVIEYWKKRALEAERKLSGN